MAEFAKDERLGTFSASVQLSEVELAKSNLSIFVKCKLS